MRRWMGRTDAQFPHRLRRAPCCPPGLYVEGYVPTAGEWVAIVGARAARASHLAIAHDLAASCASQGMVVVSGGALGIDAAAHRGAIAGGGITCAVLGSGLDRLYPRTHRALFAEIVVAGCLLSPYDLDAEPLPWRFVRRNQIMAAMCTKVVVVEGTLASGARHTARAATACGCDVFAVPGSPLTDALLAHGAGEVDVDGALFRPREIEGSPSSPPLDSPAAKVLALLAERGPHESDQLAAELGLESRIVARTLAELALDKLVFRLPGRSYCAAAFGDGFREQAIDGSAKKNE